MADGNNLVKKGLSDRRLLYILQGGDIFMLLFDPENLCRGGYVRKLCHGRVDMETAVSWEATVVFPNGDTLVAEGAWTVKEGLSVWMLKMPLPENKFEIIPSLPGKTLLTALGELSSIPIRLQRCLSPTGPKVVDYAKVMSLWGIRLFSLEEDALFWDVEGGEKDSGKRGVFNEYVVRYTRNNCNGPMKAELSSYYLLAEGRIVVSTEVDVYGLSNKKVSLERNIGMGHSVSCRCTFKRNGVLVPSLTVAFDIDSVLPVLYNKERHKGLNKGRPRKRG